MQAVVDRTKKETAAQDRDTLLQTCSPAPSFAVFRPRRGSGGGLDFQPVVASELGGGGVGSGGGGGGGAGSPVSGPGSGAGGTTDAEAGDGGAPTGTTAFKSKKHALPKRHNSFNVAWVRDPATAGEPGRPASASEVEPPLSPSKRTVARSSSAHSFASVPSVPHFTNAKPKDSITPQDTL